MTSTVKDYALGTCIHSECVYPRLQWPLPWPAVTIHGFSEPDFFFKSYLNQTQGLCMCECCACVCARAHVRAHACVCLKRARLLLQTSLRRGLLPPNSLHDSSQKSNDTRDFLAGISQMECDRNTEWRLECRNFDRHAAFATKHIW